MRIGIFGGAFDPVHLGHLILAEQCREQGQLDQVWFVPTARPPHKPATELTPFAQRVEMLQLAIAGQPAFRVEEIERDLQGPNYTAITLEELQKRHPHNDWCLLIGGDALRDLPGWYEPRRVVAAAELLVMARQGTSIAPLEELKEKLGDSTQMKIVDVPLIGISSSDLRERIRAGRSVRFMLPRAVEVYVRDKTLYVYQPALTSQA